MISTDDLQQLVRELAEACSFELELVEESLIVEGDYLAATARSRPDASASPSVKLDALAKLHLSPNDAGGTETWALAFFFVNGERVAPPGMCHLTLKLEPSREIPPRWVARGWEADVYEEWTGLLRLEREGGA